jgi:hypothetical protein
MRPPRIAPVLALVGILLLSALAAGVVLGTPDTSVTRSAPAPASVLPPATSLPSNSAGAPAPIAAGVDLPAEASALPLAPATHPDISAYAVILPDGSLGGAPAPIAVSGSVYTLTASFSGAIVDERNDSTFDGAGFTVTTSSTLVWGFQVNTTTNVSVTDLNVVGATDGFEVLNSTNVIVSHSVANSSAGTGFLAQYTSGLSFDFDFSNYSDDAFVGIDCSAVAVSDDTAIDTDLAFGFLEVDGAVVHDDTGTGATDVGLLVDSSSQVTATEVNLTGAENPVGVMSSTNVYLGEVLGPDATGAVAVVALLDSNLQLVSGNFSEAGEDGGQFLAVSDLEIQQTQFFGEPAYGLETQYGSGLTLSGVDANDSGITAFDIQNETGITVDDSFGSHAGWNGLEVKFSDQIRSTDDTFNGTLSGSGNSTLLTDCSDVTISGDTDTYSNFGIFVLDGSAVTVMGTNVSEDGTGLTFLQSGTSSAISDVADHDDTGFVWSLASGFLAEYDNASFDLDGFVDATGLDGNLWYSSTFNTSDGFLVISDSGSYFDSDRAVNCAYGLNLNDASGTDIEAMSVLNATSVGVILEADQGVLLQGSTVANSAIGFLLVLDHSTSVVRNDFTNDTNDFLIDVAGNSVDLIYWNSFVGGSGWEFDSLGGPPNAVVFDDGYPAGGNYWSNWTSPDLLSGPDQNLPGSDGIVDNPLPIGGSYADQYPLAQPFNDSNLSVTFRETGLPAGTTWGVQFSSSPFGLNTTGAEVSAPTFQVAYATYSYSVYAPAGWVPAPSHGSVTTDGSAISVTIAFTQATYATTFTATGLGAGAAWDLEVNGQYYPVSGTTVTLGLGNGTYNYSVASIAGYVVSPRNGTITVNANEQTVTFDFVPVLYTVTFSESGLPSGTSWSVTFNGVATTSTTDTITFQVANGSYAYSIGGVSGYTNTPSTGTQLVSGPGASLTVVYASTTTNLAGSAVFWGLLAAVIVLALLAVLLWVRGRKKPSAASSATPWTPPSGTAAAPPPPTGGPGSPPTGAVAPPPPPDWKEG